MNKKASSMGFIFILFCLTVGVIYLQLDKAGLDKDSTTQKLEASLRNATNITLNISTPETPEIGNALNYYINGLFLACGEIAIWGVHFVEDNPQAPYKLLLFGLILAILAPLVLVLFKLIVIIVLLTKEAIQNKREKQKLKEIDSRWE